MSPTLRRRTLTQSQIEQFEPIHKTTFADMDVASSQIELDSESSGRSTRSSVSKFHDFLEKEVCLYNHRVFELAADVFTYLNAGSRIDENKNKSIAFDDVKLQKHMVPIDATEAEKRQTFELAFATLKYESLLEFILEDCVFFSSHPELQDDVSLTMVVLCDFQSRKFQRRTPFPGEQLNSHILEVENCLYKCRTRLNASLARNRIKQQAMTVEHLLPEGLRDKEEESAKMPISAWVNLTKTTLRDVEEILRKNGITKTESLNGFDGISYMVDVLFPNLLVFSPECRSFMAQLDVVQRGLLVMQDKSSCIGPYSIAKLINGGDDVIHVNAGLGITTAHIASLLEKTSKVIAFGPTTHPEYSHTLAKLHHLGADNVKLIKEDFMDILSDDPRIRSCKVILLTALCSKTGISNPIDFIVNEGEDMSILRDLSFGSKDRNKLIHLAAKQRETLKHALSLSKIHAVVYQTRSIHEIENEIVCDNAIAYVNGAFTRKVPYRVVPPVLPFRPADIDNDISDKYIKFKATEMYSGSFVATIAREPYEAKETAKQILEKAEAKGLFKQTTSKTVLGLQVDKIPSKPEPPKPNEPEDILKQVMREYAARGGHGGTVSNKRLSKHTNKIRGAKSSMNKPRRHSVSPRRFSRDSGKSRKKSVPHEIPSSRKNATNMMSKSSDLNESRKQVSSTTHGGDSSLCNVAKKNFELLPRDSSRGTRRMSTKHRPKEKSLCEQYISLSFELPKQNGVQFGKGMHRRKITKQNTDNKKPIEDHTDIESFLSINTELMNRPVIDSPVYHKNGPKWSQSKSFNIPSMPKNYVKSEYIGLKASSTVSNVKQVQNQVCQHYKTVSNVSK